MVLCQLNWQKKNKWNVVLQRHDTIPVDEQDHRKAEASRDHSSPNPLPWSRAPGCSWSCPVWGHHNLWATCSVFDKWTLNTKLSRYFQTTPIQMTLFLKGRAWYQAKLYKQFPIKDLSLKIPGNFLATDYKECFLGKKKEQTKPKPNKYKRNCTRKISGYFFPSNSSILQPLCTKTLALVSPALVRGNGHLPCSCSSSCRASTPLLPEGPAPSSDTDSPSRSREDTELERLEGPGKTDFTLKLIWITVPKYKALTIQDTKKSPEKLHEMK